MEGIFSESLPLLLKSLSDRSVEFSDVAVKCRRGTATPREKVEAIGVVTAYEALSEENGWHDIAIELTSASHRMCISYDAKRRTSVGCAGEFCQDVLKCSWTR